MKKTNYPGDLSDLEWNLLEPELRGSIKFGVFCRPPGYALREIVNGCLYLLKTGCQWRFLPRDFPPYNVVFYYFNRWRKNKILEKVNESLAKKVRVEAGRNEELKCCYY
jgi:putative transposase